MPEMISKTDFNKAKHCLKRLYLSRYRRDLSEPQQLDGRLEDGTQIGALGRRYYAEGILITWGSVDLLPELATEFAIKSGIDCLYEATFRVKERGLLVKCDILRRLSGSSTQWHLIEVKSGTSVKSEYIIDAAFQAEAVAAAGIDVKKISILHVNNSYIHEDDQIDVHRFFTEVDVTAHVQKAIERVRTAIIEVQSAIAEESEPNVRTNKHCFDPPCEFRSYCHANQPEHDLIYLPRISPQQVAEYREAGYETIDAIPRDKLKPQWNVIWNVVKSHNPHFGKDLRKAIQPFAYPLHFIDFESVGTGMPLFKGVKPYEAIVFQWSNHIIDQPGAEPRHEEFLSRDASDPRPEFAATLWNSIRNAGTIFVYSSFEATQLKALATNEVPYGTELCFKLDRCGIDLYKVIKDHVYHQDFRGSYSIKKVLPALVPGLSYADLPIHDGGTASLKYLEMLGLKQSDESPNEISKNLLDYCYLDTLAMVEIWRILQLHTSHADGLR
jgi:CRISPR/Cas system-associated exonuclease Cas4 (RecB family)